MKYTGERIIPEENFCGPETNIYKEHVARYPFSSKYTNGEKVLDIEKFPDLILNIKEMELQYE